MSIRFLWILLHTDGSKSAKPPRSKLVGLKDYTLFPDSSILRQNVGISDAININTIVIIIDIMMLKSLNPSMMGNSKFENNLHSGSR